MTNFHVNTPDKTSETLYRYGYKLGRSIGQGSYCKVRVALKITNSSCIRKIACKSIDKKRASLDYVKKFLPRELSILKKIIHPNIVSVHDIIEINEQVHIFMDLCENGDLLEHIRCNGPMQESRAKKFFRQLVSALEYLHGMDWSHRDIKCENILLSSRDTVKITDFGFARFCRDKNGNRVLSDTFCGSAAYAAPEIIQGMSYNPKMYDMWSLGCVLYIMLAACMPFDDTNVRRMLKAQLSHKVTFPSSCDASVSQAARRIVRHLLEPDITRRATIRQLARYPWMSPSVERPFGNPDRPPTHGRHHGAGDSV